MLEIKFSHQKRVKKAFFFYLTSPQGSCFAIIRVSLIYKGGRKHCECLNFNVILLSILKKPTSLYDHFEGLTTDSYLVKQDPLGGGQIEKKAFLTPLLMRKHDF